MTLRVLILLVVLLPSTAVAAQTYADEAWDWVNEVESNVWGAIAPVDPENESELPYTRDEEWVALITSTDGWGNHWQILLTTPWRGLVNASFVYVDDLRGQLVEMWSSGSGPSAEDAVSQLVYRDGVASGGDCATLRALADELERLELPVIPERVLVLHTPTFRVKIATAGREQREFVVLPGENELSEWCSRAITELLGCAKAR